MNLVKLPIYERPTDERFRVQNFDILLIKLDPLTYFYILKQQPSVLDLPGVTCCTSSNEKREVIKIFCLRWAFQGPLGPLVVLNM